MSAKLSLVRGRPRQFDSEAAIAVGQRLFHEHGYDAVGLAALTDALGIKPPSFYAAYGSKAGFFARVLDRYASSVLTLEDLLRPGRDPAEALTDLLMQAARTYSADPQRRGCLVLEAVRGNDDAENVLLAREVAEERRAQIRSFVSVTHPGPAAAVTDFVASTMSGLSASAREGMDQPRLLQVAQAAAMALPLLIAKQ